MKTAHLINMTAVLAMTAGVGVRLEDAEVLDVGQRPLTPFGGKLRGSYVPGAVSVGDSRPVPSTALPGCGTPSGGAMNAVADMIARLGGTPCRLWGASPPVPLTEGCPNWKKVCGAILPYNVSVSASATAQSYTVLAKKWFWPLFWVDASASTVTVTNLTFQGDPVFENGTGSGALIVSSLLTAAGNYSFIPGMPAIDNTNGLVFTLANSAASAAQYQGMFVGVSIRN